MVLHKKNTDILYLEKNSFSFYSTDINPLTFTYPAGSVLELEVVNQELFAKDLGTFITTNKLLPAPILMLISSDFLYEREFLDETFRTGEDQEEAVDENKPEVTETNQPQNTSQHQKTPAKKVEKLDSAALTERQSQIQMFLDTVPFEEVTNRVYKLENGVKVIATNKNLCKLIQTIFTKHGFQVEGIVPITMLGAGFSPSDVMSEDLAKKIFAKFDLIKPNALQEVVTPLPDETPSSHGIKMSTKVSSKREYGLIGVFGVLLVVLGYMVYTSVLAPADTQVASIEKKVTPTAIPPTEIPTPTPVATTSALINRSELRIRVNNGTALQADLLRQQLISSGFANVTTRPNNVPATGRTLVVFSNTLSSTAREEILNEISKNLLEVSVQESITPDIDVTINL